jgi:two-component system, chemotaxis family, protein-glutamate methylesterase/glutaminase
MRSRTPLGVKEAIDGEVPRAGTVYLAPEGRNLAITESGRVCVCDANRLQYVRPSADLLFSSLASHYSNRAVAVVLTGSGRDGAEGVRAVRNAGGYVISQSIETAEHVGMPTAAIETRKVDVVLSLKTIGLALCALADIVSQS